MKNQQTYTIKLEIWDKLKKLYPNDINTSLNGDKWIIWRAFKVVFYTTVEVDVLDTALLNEYYIKNGVDKISPYYNIQNLFTLKAINSALELENTPRYFQ